MGWSLYLGSDCVVLSVFIVGYVVNIMTIVIYCPL